jgi:hypothetical protein
MNEFYVYLYRRNDTNDVFYIGNVGVKIIKQLALSVLTMI